MVNISASSAEDAEEILALQKLAFQSEARLYNDWSLAPLTESIESLVRDFSNSVILKATLGDRLVGSVRARRNGDTCSIARLIVHPELQRQGIGSQLLHSIEARFPDVSRFELYTGSKSEGNIRLYQRHGYAIIRTEVVSPTVSLAVMDKRPKEVLHPFARHGTHEE